MIHINTSLLAAFISIRLSLGIPTKDEIVSRILKTNTHTIYPDGWEFK
jgi:hypothetical protein